MSASPEMARIKKTVRKTLLIEVLREFSGLTEQELRSALKHSKEKIDADRCIREHGLSWDLEALNEPNGREEVPVAKAIQERVRLRGPDKPIVSEQRALKIIDETAPDITPDDLAAWISMSIELNRRTPSELTFFRKHGYFPEWEPGRTHAEIEHFQRHACWPESNANADRTF